MPELPNTSFNSDVIAEFRANGGRVEGLWPYQTDRPPARSRCSN